LVGGRRSLNAARLSPHADRDRRYLVAGSVNRGTVVDNRGIRQASRDS
jgi:hypothetical protein